MFMKSTTGVNFTKLFFLVIDEGAKYARVLIPAKFFLGWFDFF
jgi:hypothetical protein